MNNVDLAFAIARRANEAHTRVMSSLGARDTFNTVTHLHNMSDRAEAESQLRAVLARMTAAEFDDYIARAGGHTP